MSETTTEPKRFYGIIREQRYQGPRLTILRLQQDELRRKFLYDLTEEELDEICTQSEWALTTYRKRREAFAENGYERKTLEALWECSVEIAREERKQVPAPPPRHSDPAHWLDWSRSEWPCVY